MFYSYLGDDREPKQFKNSLKNARDAFDGYHKNPRQGWKSSSSGKPAPLPVLADKTLKKWKRRRDSELFAAIEGLISEKDLVERLLASTGSLPELSDIELRQGTVIKERRSRGATNGLQGVASLRRSANAKRVGDRAELIVKQLLESELPQAAVRSIDHHAARGDKPGYDISYTEDGKQIAIEVKGTTQGSMDSFDITAREVEAARKFGRRYRIYLVSGVDTDSPRYQIISGLGNEFQLTPLTYRAELIASVGEL